MKGRVYLVGAGPGDPELLTLKAVRLLNRADVVLHDELVSEQILSLVPDHAQTRNVGKRCGKKKISQEEINFLMVELAGSGLQVVRLKGGDPLIFGRIGEEIAALRAANVDFEIVPGITAALGAASSTQLPLTDRRSSHALVFLAGHSASGDDSTNWRALAALGATIVIYMPGYRYAEIARRMLSSGLSADTPCAIISRATTSDEQVFATTIGALDQAPRLPAPAILVVGEVLRHAASLPEHLGTLSSSFAEQIPFVLPTQPEITDGSSLTLGAQKQGV